MLAIFASLTLSTPPAPPPQTESASPAKAIGTPVAVISGWINGRDFPKSALKRGSQGVTQIRIRVTAEGRAEDCQIFQSAGDAELDAAACAIVTSRTRFRPATDTDGKPTWQYAMMPVRWIIGD
ncbi:MAG: energy transducer TonB [Pseudomonadota bacterium]